MITRIKIAAFLVAFVLVVYYGVNAMGYAVQMIAAHQQRIAGAK